MNEHVGAGRAGDATGTIDGMFHPRSIAIVGATERPGYGRRVVDNLRGTGFGGKVYPINPNRSTVFDLPCYRSPLELPEAPDLAMVIVPAERVVESLRQCAEVGTRGAVVISAGFAELPADEGERRQAELRALAAETGLRIVGPNCLGLANVPDNVWATATTRRESVGSPEGTGAALISQSGATAFGPLQAVANDRGLGFRYVVTTGNEADLGATDFLEYFLGRDDVRVVSLLLEGIRDFGRFKRLAEEALRREKTLVVQKVGRSEAGQRAARSHTAALTGSDRAQDALFRQLGVVRVRDYDELVEQTAMFLKLAAPLPAGPRVGVISHSGGIGAHLSDLLGVEGLEVLPFADETRRRVGEVLGERGSANNPADLTTFLNSPALGPLLEALFSDPGQDAWLLATQGSEELVGRIVEAAVATPKPVGVVWTGSHANKIGLPVLQASSVPTFLLPSGGARGMAALVRLARARERAAADSRSESAAGSAGGVPLGSDEAGTLSEHRSKQLLAAYGVESPPETLAQTAEAAVEAAGRLGYPVVLKACGPELPHKTELGLVRLDLRTEDDVRRAYAEVITAAGEVALEGVLVQPFVRGGVETIVGLSDDPQLGPLVLLGLGGTLVETLGAVTWRACPIGPAEAEAMIDEVPALPALLRGVRGAPPADRGALARALVAVSRLAVDLGERLETLDVNPLLVRPAGGALALDALAVLRAPGGPASRSP